MFTLILGVAGGIVLGVYALRAIPRIFDWLRRVLVWALAWLVVYPLVTASVYALRCAVIAAAVAGPVAYIDWLWRLSPYLGWGAFAGTVALYWSAASLYLTHRAKAAQVQAQVMAAEIRARREAEEVEAAKLRAAPGTPFVRGLDYLGTIALARGGSVRRE